MMNELLTKSIEDIDSEVEKIENEIQRVVDELNSIDRQINELRKSEIPWNLKKNALQNLRDSLLYMRDVKEEAQ